MKQKKVKCIVWDLDNTLWKGVLLENDEIELSENIKDIIHELDERGILQSIASKNDFDVAWKKLETLGISDYFLVPQISWKNKSESIKLISELLNIGLDTIAFVDDQEYERDEVKSIHQEVRCYTNEQISQLLKMEEFNPVFITDETNQMYQTDFKRKNDENNFNGTNVEFVKNLNLKLSISLASNEDLKRVEELTLRTSQMNTTGIVFTYEELLGIIHDEKYRLYVVELEDRYGGYGKVGLILLDVSQEQTWIINLFILSCSVMTRGLGNVLLNYILNLAKKKRYRVKAMFKPTNRNRIMMITYQFAGFKIFDERDDILCLEHDLQNIENLPDYVEIVSKVD